MADHPLHLDRVRAALDAVDAEHERQGVERSAAAREADALAHRLGQQIRQAREDDRD